MKVRRMVSAVVALAASTALVCVAAPGAQAASDHSATTSTTAKDNPSQTVKALFSASGFQKLIDSVTAAVHAQYPNAVLGLVTASSPTGPTTRIADVTRWDFSYTAVTSDRHRVVVTATVHLPSWTPTIVAAPSPVFGLHIQQPLTMGPFEAALLARIAGYRDAYDDVWLHQPQGFNPRYTFFTSTGPVSVDTVTRQVTPDF